MAATGAQMGLRLVPGGRRAPRRAARRACRLRAARAAGGRRVDPQRQAARGGADRRASGCPATRTCRRCRRPASTCRTCRRRAASSVRPACRPDAVAYYEDLLAQDVALAGLAEVPEGQPARRRLSAMRRTTTAFLGDYESQLREILIERREAGALGRQAAHPTPEGGPRVVHRGRVVCSPVPASGEGAARPQPLRQSVRRASPSPSARRRTAGRRGSAARPAGCRPAGPAARCGSAATSPGRSAPSRTAGTPARR